MPFLPPCCPLANTGIPHAHGTVLCPDLTYRNCAVGFPFGQDSILVIMAYKHEAVLLNKAVREAAIDDGAAIYHRAVEQFLEENNDDWNSLEWQLQN